MPKRIQRKRTKGWKMPANSIYVGRPTKWGNPYHVGYSYADEDSDELRSWIDISAETAIQFYIEAIQGAYPCVPFTINEIRQELTGKDLVCWCPLDQPCHADVLLRLANT
jgi:hypothetical protein